MDSETMCRVCLSESNELTPLRARIPGKHKTLEETINFVVNINIVLEHGLPDRICKDCKTVLDSADTFKQRVLKSEAILSQLDKRKDTDESRPSFVNKGLENNEIYSDDASSLPTAVSYPTSSYMFEVKIENEEHIYDLPEYKIKTEIDENYVGDEIATSEQKHSETAPSKSKQQLCIKEEVPVELVNYSDNKEWVLGTSKHTQVLCYSCKKCGRDFPSGESLESHQLEHRKGVADSRSAKYYTCRICKKKFCEKSQLDIHKRTHTDNRPYSCNVCHKAFSQKCYLVEHLRIHTGDKPYVCNVCEKKFKTSSAIVRHRRIHTGEKPYCCNVCEKKFSDRSVLVKHLKTHTGEKPYSCNVCEKKFNQKPNLNRHIITHRR